MRCGFKNILFSGIAICLEELCLYCPSPHGETEATTREQRCHTSHLQDGRTGVFGRMYKMLTRMRKDRLGAGVGDAGLRTAQHIH